MTPTEAHDGHDLDAGTLSIERGAGGQYTAEDLIPLVYDELRRLAASRLAHLPPGQTLQPTALVHDAFLRVVGDSDSCWNGQAHFFGAAAVAMRNILVDQARRKSAVKHGGDLKRVPADASDLPDIATVLASEEILSLDPALDQFTASHPRHARVVMLRYFVGMTNEQIAEVMDIGISTVKRDWRFACAWLRRRMEGEEVDDA
jgi:RNA polymerase sigma factor (TIGR02999 family)